MFVQLMTMWFLCGGQLGSASLQVQFVQVLETQGLVGWLGAGVHLLWCKQHCHKSK
jgi:hypothetical protein